MSSMFLARVIPLASLFVSGVWAQFDMAKCGSGFEWNLNSLNQDPCTVGSMLDAECRDLVLYSYPPLNASHYYLPPRADNANDLKCDCNSVMYNLYMACASCQQALVYDWTKWIPACPAYQISEYPHDIAQGTAVPRWAYFNVTSTANQTYNEVTMISIGRNPEVLPEPITTTSAGGGSTTTTRRNTLTQSGTQTLAGSDPTSTDSTKGGTNVGAIVGGVVGSVVPLTILAAVIFFYTRRRRQQPPQEQIQNPDGLDPYRQNTASMYGPSMTSAPLYNPSDPSTFPPQSPQNSVTYTTPGFNPNARGTYSGVPEV